MRRPIRLVDGVFCVIPAEGPALPLRMHGNPLTKEGPEWLLDAFYPGFGRLRVVQWRRKDGTGTVHYYNEVLEFLGAGFGQLRSDDRAILSTICIPELTTLWSGIIDGGADRAIVISDEFRALGPNAREEIADFLWPVLHRPAREIILDQLTASQKASLPVPHGLIEEAFQCNFLDVQIRAMANGGVCLSGDESIIARSGIFLQDTGFVPVHAYRFELPTHSEIFYAVCADWNYGIQCFYFPRRELIIFPNASKRTYLNGHMRKPVDRALFGAVAKDADLLCEYIPHGNDSLAIFNFYRHIGHYLWNELTGLEAVSEAEAGLPIYSVGSTMSEMYGDIEDIFAQHSPTVDRTIGSLWELPRVIYSKRLGFLHPTGNRISTKLRRRILENVDRVSSSTDIGELYRSVLDAYRNIVVLGLRVENRTLVDLAEFFKNVINFLASELGRVVIIIDGHNTSWQTGQSYHTIGNSLGIHQPDQVEREILVKLCRAFAHDDRVKLISTLGSPVSSSIFWGSRADFFVAPWGAGLAKYRWVCNLPGVIVSSRYFLRHPESRLYDDEHYLEDPAPTFRIEPEESIDMPEAPQFVPLPGEGRHNFEVQIDAVRREIKAAIDSIRERGSDRPR